MFKTGFHFNNEAITPKHLWGNVYKYIKEKDLPEV